MMEGDDSEDIFSHEVNTRIHRPCVSQSASFRAWNVSLGGLDKHDKSRESHQLYQYQEPSATMTRTRRTRHMCYTWDQCFRARTTPTKFFIAIFYVALCSFLLTLYFWQYSTQTLPFADIRIDARGLKSATRYPETNIRGNEKETNNRDNEMEPNRVNGNNINRGNEKEANRDNVKEANRDKAKGTNRDSEKGPNRVNDNNIDSVNEIEANRDNEKEAKRDNVKEANRDEAKRPNRDSEKGPNRVNDNKIDRFNEKEAKIGDNGNRVQTGVKMTVNATQVPPTTQAFQQIEPKNWAGDGYISVPGGKTLDRKCDTCAVVTSSGHLKHSKLGSKIDSADCVIRMNAAPSLKFEADVGSRTTFRVIGHRNFPSMFKTEESQLYHISNTTTRSDYIVVSWLYGVNLKKNTPYKMCHILQKKYKYFKCYLGTEDTMNRSLDLFYSELGISRDKIKLWLSTGWTTMLFALEVCDKIDVYGMVYDGYCDEHPKDKTLYHYYDKVRSECSYYSRSERRTTGGHKFLTEKAIIGKWASIYNITFHRPSWEDHMIRHNLSSSIDSPYKRIYHYLQWKQENENKTKNASKSVENRDIKQGDTKETAEFTIRNKKTTGDKALSLMVDNDDSRDIVSGNETMKSENIMAYAVDGAKVVVVDRETGKTVKVSNSKQSVQVKQKQRKDGGKPGVESKVKILPDIDPAQQIIDSQRKTNNSKSNLPAEKGR